MKRALFIFFLGIHASFAWPLAGARASEPRRPGLGGSVSTRKLTAPLNSLAIIFGPGQTPLFGQRYRDRVTDGGFSVARAPASLGGSTAHQTELWARAGVVFGLSEHLEAGALFLNFQLTPDFTYSDFPVYLTYGWFTENVDIGARFSFTTPADSGIWNLNPGIPFLIRLSNSRIDTGIFVPMAFDDPFNIGLNVPTRFTYQFTPHLFTALESGFSASSFQPGGHLTVPLGGLMGYSIVSGAKVIDFTAQFAWDEFSNWGGASGPSDLELSSYRILAGLTIHKIVM